MNKAVAFLCWLIPGLLMLACNQDVNQGNPDGGESTVAIDYSDQEQQVDLSKLDTVVVSDTDVVKLSTVVAAAYPSAGDVEADFVASDGFRPASKSDCLPLIPVPNDLLDKGYIDPVTRNLIWDDDLGYGGCMHVKDVATIMLSDAGSQGVMLTIELGGNQVEIDLGFQPTEQVGDEQLVPLQTVVKASGVAGSPQLYDYDFEGSDGFRPTADKSADPLSWDDVGSGYINPATRDLTFDQAAGLSGYWNVNDTAIVHLIETEVSPKKVTVVHGSDEATIDLGDLDTVDVGGVELVPLQDVVNESALVGDPSVLVYDFEGSDGFRPTVDRGADPLSWGQIGSGYIQPASRDLTWDDALGLPGYWSVSDAARIHLIDQ